MAALSFAGALLGMTRPKEKPDDLELIERETRTQFFRFFIWARLALVPLIVAMAAWIALVDQLWWRQVLMGLVIVALTTISVWDVALYSLKGVIGVYAIPRNVIGAGLATLVLIVATGGLDSPYLPVILVVSLVTTIFVSPLLGRIIVLGLQLPVIWASAVIGVYELVPGFVPDVFGGGRRACGDDVLLWTQALVYTLVLTAIISFGVRIRRTFELMLARIFEERDEQLRIYEDQAKTLTTLSGEIAHELKNPLASVKGLAALVSRSLEGKAAERMGVLRGEVERMQSILEEFLNFSRPLVPLSLEQTRLGAIAGEVVELHEGLARERGISLALSVVGQDGLRCDPRKLKQVLINLVQNAIEASPEGGRVTIVVGGESAEVEARVADEGPGPPQELGRRIFEAGVTGKPTGSGLGLTVALAVARQHGGELTLERGPSGGCLALLRLPCSPPVDEPSPAGEAKDEGAEG